MHYTQTGNKTENLYTVSCEKVIATAGILLPLLIAEQEKLNKEQNEYTEKNYPNHKGCRAMDPWEPAIRGMDVSERLYRVKELLHFAEKCTGSVALKEKDMAHLFGGAGPLFGIPTPTP